MARNKTPEQQDGPDPARYAVSDLDKAKAAKWFERAFEFGNRDKKYDSAIEYYVQGINFWPDAVEQGLKPLHACALAFRQSGGKKPGLKDTMKRSMTAKDPKEALINSLWLFGHEYDNLSYVEGVLKNADRLHAEECLMWAAGIYRKLLDDEKKPSTKRYMLLKETLEGAADRAVARGEIPAAIAALEVGVQALSALAHRQSGKDRELDNALRDLTTKLTIVRGRYQEADSFRESIRDESVAKELHDRERLVQAEGRVDELIASAQKAYDAAPDDVGKLTLLIDLLCRRERFEEECKAIGVLVNHFKRTGKYHAKQKADEIRMKQLRRDVRAAREKGDAEALREAQVNQIKFELAVYKDRMEQYPTDLRIKFEYAQRLFQGGRYDEAIPLLQAARSDPKSRAQCSLYLGRCFYKKGFFPQAVSTLSAALAEREMQDDDTAKEIAYYLGRAQESGGQVADARKTYGRLLELDYNYRDVRQRLESLPQQ
ncbi:MAG: hypothetical protein FLDDKLPJ_02113 [Phycisphaerae bacterium]|nr:hypothetical protein [Phycisphaerae bacterium]